MIVDGKAFIITGGLGSIGRAAAEILVEKGAYIVAFDILSPEDGEAKIKTFAKPNQYFYEQTDIADRTKMKAACDSALKKIPKGSLFGAIHCAAIAPGRPWTKSMTEKLDDFVKVMNVNAVGTFTVNALVADAINSQYPELDIFHERVSEERGVIINLSSVVGHDIPARSLTYGVSKRAVLGITEAAADFLAPSGIRVNSVAPALVISPIMLAGGRDKYFQAQLDQYSMFPRRFTEPSEIGSAIVFLIENSMMNAFHLKVDAGWKQLSSWALGDPRKISPLLE
ncbi:3-hydroxyacyl-CoA dehydrogenase [Cryptococcus neoformans var. grubii Br795]|nr:hypothetical protein AYX15_06680 [Cryptococcus neoformans var. grubii]OWZ63700.1 hypothetical protein AYX14_06661 [Cryptococcus neoformans var. grubii]OXG84267.1 3-hydroxyacyl-CoA dehydrogenase [Cryptococcus neoformans var. grubii Br795]